jgi:hypothetical protein
LWQVKSRKCEQDEYVIFEHTYASKNLEDHLSLIKWVNPSYLPPCQSSWEQAQACEFCCINVENPRAIKVNNTHKIDWYIGPDTNIYQILNQRSQPALYIEDEDEEYPLVNQCMDRTNQTKMMIINMHEYYIFIKLHKMWYNNTLLPYKWHTNISN